MTLNSVPLDFHDFTTVVLKSLQYLRRGITRWLRNFGFIALEVLEAWVHFVVLSLEG